MDADRLQRVFEVFDAAAALPEAEREGFIATECGSDVNLRDEVRSLLAAHDDAEGFLSASRPMLDGVAARGAGDALAPGTRLGSFAVERFVGAGGMGEVYRAHDTRLERDVAIKVLRSDTAGDPRSRARFAIEARAIARLSHPRICAIHDVAHHDGLDFLVMEFLEGETLAERLRRKPLSLAEALRTATEIAEALTAAHARGIVHRDLKPGNVMLTAAGAKLLDFGLARLRTAGVLEPDALTTTDVGIHHSAAGTIAGTIHYMAPEQLEGREVDARADVFAFGVVLYEIVSGQKPFESTTHQGIITAILSSEPPPLAERKPVAPAALDRLIRTALAKDPARRWASMQDVLLQLEWIARDAAEGLSATPASARPAWVVGAALLATVLTVAGAFWWYARRLVAEPQMHVSSVAPPTGAALATEHPPAISADGRRLAFVAFDADGHQLLYHQSLDSVGGPQAIANTDGAFMPFWSPAGDRIGFFSNGLLKTVELSSGRIQPLAPAGQPRGGTWNERDEIIFVPRPLDGFYLVSAQGGRAEPLALKISPGPPGWYPAFLPDGRHFLTFVPSPQDPDKASVSLVSIAARTRTLLIEGTRSNAVYATPGYLLFWRDGTLLAQPFDPAALRLQGMPTAVAAAAGLNRLTNQGLFAVSESGTLVFFGSAVGQTQLEWVDRSGARVGDPGPIGLFNSMSLSPDDGSVVYDRADARSGGVDLHRFDFATRQESRRTFHASHDMFPLWSPDGRAIFFNSLRAGPPQLFQIDADATGNERQILQKPFPTMPGDVSRDGSLLLYHGILRETSSDVFALALDGTGKEVAVLASAATESQAALSPDGRLLAYVSNANSTYEVYVQEFPIAEGGQQWQISNGGGIEPYWRRDGRELYFIAPDRRLMAVEVTGTGAAFRHGRPSALFPTRVKWFENQALGRHFAPSRDGRRFLVANATEDARATSMTIVLNWTAGLRK